MDESILELLGVVIVEGDRPNSTYYAAELEGDIAHANAKLIENMPTITYANWVQKTKECGMR